MEIGSHRYMILANLGGDWTLLSKCWCFGGLFFCLVCELVLCVVYETRVHSDSYKQSYKVCSCVGSVKLMTHKPTRELRDSKPEMVKPHSTIGRHQCVQ